MQQILHDGFFPMHFQDNFHYAFAEMEIGRVYPRKNYQTDWRLLHLLNSPTIQEQNRINLFHYKSFGGSRYCNGQRFLWSSCHASSSKPHP